MRHVQRQPELLLLFRIAGRLCALPIRSLVEVLRPMPLGTIPDAPSGVVGLAIIRGEPVPVVSLEQSSLAFGPGARFIVLRLGDRRVTLAVDEVVGLHPLDHEQLHPLPPLLSGYEAMADSIGTHDGELLAVLSAPRLVPEDVLRLSETRSWAS